MFDSKIVWHLWATIYLGMSSHSAADIISNELKVITDVLWKLAM